jgi:hypothetical protein
MGTSGQQTVNVQNLCLSVEIDPNLRPWLSRLARLDCYTDETQTLQEVLQTIQTTHPSVGISWGQMKMYFTRGGFAGPPEGWVNKNASGKSAASAGGGGRGGASGGTRGGAGGALYKGAKSSSSGARGGAGAKKKPETVLTNEKNQIFTKGSGVQTPDKYTKKGMADFRRSEDEKDRQRQDQLGRSYDGGPESFLSTEKSFQKDRQKDRALHARKPNAPSPKREKQGKGRGESGDAGKAGAGYDDPSKEEWEVSIKELEDLGIFKK